MKLLSAPRQPFVGLAAMAAMGTITAEIMRDLNYQVDVLHRDLKDVVARFLDRATTLRPPRVGSR